MKRWPLLCFCILDPETPPIWMRKKRLGQLQRSRTPYVHVALGKHHCNRRTSEAAWRNAARTGFPLTSPGVILREVRRPHRCPQEVKPRKSRWETANALHSQSFTIVRCICLSMHSKLLRFRSLFMMSKTIVDYPSTSCAAIALLSYRRRQQLLPRRRLLRRCNLRSK